MNDTNLYQYEIFCVVAESRTYKEASSKLYLTESTISTHIKNLEQKLGITLFYRERGGLTLTRAGEELYNLVNERIKELELTERIIIQNYNLDKARITIGCPSHISIFYLTKCIKKIKNDYPNLKIDIVSASDYGRLIDLLQNHKLDMVIIDIIPENINNEISIKPIKEINNIFISKEKIDINDIKDLEKYNYILNFETSNSTKELFKTLKNYGVSINADIHADTTEMRIEEVKQGQGIGYVMRESVEDYIKKGELFEVKLPIKLPEVKINLLYIEKYLTKVDRIFIKKYLDE